MPRMAPGAGDSRDRAASRIQSGHDSRTQSKTVADYPAAHPGRDRGRLGAPPPPVRRRVERSGRCGLPGGSRNRASPRVPRGGHHRREPTRPDRAESRHPTARGRAGGGAAGRRAGAVGRCPRPRESVAVAPQRIGGERRGQQYRRDWSVSAELSAGVRGHACTSSGRAAVPAGLPTRSNARLTPGWPSGAARYRRHDRPGDRGRDRLSAELSTAASGRRAAAVSARLPSGIDGRSLGRVGRNQRDGT
jgi:hypothetical protein